MVTVIGLDISLTGTGIARSDSWCSAVGKAQILSLPLGDRIEWIDWLADEILTHVPRDTALAAIETPAFSRAYGGAVERHALWYRVAAGLKERCIPVAEVPATSLKKYATGKGSSTKAAMVDALARRMPQFVTRGNDNLVDAAWLAAMGADHLGHPIVAMPEAHRAALAGVTWPTTDIPAGPGEGARP